MTEDTKKILEDIERELLLSQDPMEEDELLADLPEVLTQEDKQQQVDAALERILEDSMTGDVAFEDPDLTRVLQEPTEVYNYYNDYGRDIPDQEPEGKNVPGKKKKKEDNTLIVLMAIASFLCLGIIGVLIYWVEAFLK